MTHRPVTATWDDFWRGKRFSAQGTLTQRIIWNRLLRHVDLRGKGYLEIGAGSGVSCKMALQAGASGVTLVDFSRESLDNASRLFSDGDPVEYIHADVFSMKTDRKYDIVASNGLIEHFQDRSQYLRLLRIHMELAREKAVFLAPAGPHFNDIRVRYRWALGNYGWQRPIRKRQMIRDLEECGARIDLVERFYPLYGIRLNQLFPFRLRALGYADSVLDRLQAYRIAALATAPLGPWLGGYLIGVTEGQGK